jgi:hypothetical protein
MGKGARCRNVHATHCIHHLRRSTMPASSAACWNLKLPASLSQLPKCWDVTSDPSAPWPAGWNASWDRRVLSTRLCALCLDGCSIDNPLSTAKYFVRALHDRGRSTEGWQQHFVSPEAVLVAIKATPCGSVASVAVPCWRSGSLFASRKKIVCSYSLP